MKLFIFFIAIISLSACTNTRNGNFSKAPEQFNQVMAADAVKQLIILYPPALTRFDEVHSFSDPFGISLEYYLRNRGYAVKTYTTEKNTTSVLSSGGGVKLAYTVDSVENTNLFRVTLTIGNTKLSRAYVSQSGSVYPAVTWTRKN